MSDVLGPIFELLTSGLQFACMAAFAALPLALIVFLIDVSVGRKFAARYRCLLWTVVAIRMLMPVAPTSSFSIQNVWRCVSDRVVAQKPSAASDLAHPDLVATRNSPIAAVGAVKRMSANPQTDTARLQAPPIQSFEGWPIVMVWSMGVAVILLRATAASLLFARKLRQIPELDDRRMIDMLMRVCDQLRVGPRPRMKFVPNLSAPALFGLFRPTLCLPMNIQADVNDSDLRMIMIHEVMHIRRRDAILRWFLTLVRAWQWFNPIAWLATSRIAMHGECACDDAVHQFTEPAERRCYADLVLRFARQRPTGGLALAGLWFSRPARRLAARMEAFSKTKQSQRGIVRLATLAVVSLVAVGGLTDAATSDRQSTRRHHPAFFVQGSSTWAQIDAKNRNPLQHEPGDEFEEREYDVKRALANLAQANPEIDAKEWLRSYVFLPPQPERGIANVRIDGETLWLRTTRLGHQSFSRALQGLTLSGPWQVRIATRVIDAPRGVSLGEIDWNDAVKFALPKTTHPAAWPDGAEGMADTGKSRLSLTVESLSRQYAPYLAILVDREQTHRMIERCQGDARINVMQAPSVTVCNGCEAEIRDETRSPFVVGVQSVKGSAAVAQQPEIVVLTDGLGLDVRPIVTSEDALDLRCRITVSEILGAGLAKLPGMEVTVQAPNISSKMISARCRISPGQTLLIAAPKVIDDETRDSEIVYYALTAEWWRCTSR